MSRLIEAKVELAQACERRNTADIEFRAAANRRDVGDMLGAARHRSQERHTIDRLLDEIAKLEAREAREAELVRDFGPDVPGELR